MTDWLSFSPRTKSIALLVATLLLGVVLGALLNAWWAHERFERIRRLRSPGGFEQIMTRTLDPTSPEQRRDIEAVVGPTAKRLDSLRAQHWREVRRVVDSMRTELEPVLSKDQRKALDRRIEMHRRRAGPPGPRLRGRRTGPPPPQPGLRDGPPE